MKSLNIIFFIIFILQSVSINSAYADPVKLIMPCGFPDDMNCFVNKEIADAEMVNANFKAILDRSWNKSGDNFYVKDGMIGIGLTNPQKKFHVNGDTLIDNGCLFIKRHIYWLNQDNSLNSVLYNSGNNIAFQFLKNGAGGGDTIHILRDPATENNVKTFAIGNYSIHGNNQNGYQLLDVYGSTYIMNNLGIGTTAPKGKLDVNGTIYQRGIVHSSKALRDGYKVESIQEHAKDMFTNGKLKAIPKNQKDINGGYVIELGSQLKGIVEELEKAHIYIHQLNTTIQNQQKIIKELSEKISFLQIQYKN